MEQNNNPRVIDFSNDLESVNDDKSPDVKAFKNTVSKMTDIFIAKNELY